ncbi:hypothetical protein HPB49_010889 [Dermacentor silvarum]|uniref:Uncharacterized protein n=1 Tax=Dermacentor silvarum TaxID=543639 RepID=A0ACB8CWK9_DERSI|nr:hypothetical protein HPB49_010889 [Dermacentor silvarum]
MSVQVSGLHVFHHCVIAWNMWICVTYGAQAQTIFVTCMNTLVHLVMYSYYFLAALGPRAQPFLWWKRYLTQVRRHFYINVSSINQMHLSAICGAKTIMRTALVQDYQPTFV